MSCPFNKKYLAAGFRLGKEQGDRCPTVPRDIPQSWSGMLQQISYPVKRGNFAGFFLNDHVHTTFMFC